MRLSVLVLALAGLLVACRPPPAGEDLFSADGETIAMSGGRGGAANACFRCHGLDGAGDKVSVPRLAGLEAGYLQKQLEDYASQLRLDRAMHEAARWLSASDRRAVAAYYSAMPAAPSPASPVRAPAVWEMGDRARGLAACAACHGDDGRGVGSGGPALAGQPHAYTLGQIQAWRTAERRNDPGGLMSSAVATLTPEEGRAIAFWLEQQPAFPRPYSDAARLSGAEAAAAQLAASRGKRRPGRSGGV